MNHHENKNENYLPKIKINVKSLFTKAYTFDQKMACRFVLLATWKLVPLLLLALLKTVYYCPPREQLLFCEI